MEFQSQELLSQNKYNFALISNAGRTEASISEEPGAVVPHAGSRCGGCRATGISTVTVKLVTTIKM